MWEAEKVAHIAWSIGLILVTAMICTAASYGCVNSNQQYYDAMKQCVAAGGSAVPAGANGGAGIVCIQK